MVCNVLQIKSNQVSVVLCLEVVVAFLIQVSLFHDPVGNKTVSKNPGNFQLFFKAHIPWQCQKIQEIYIILVSLQAHWTDLLGAMCILAAVAGMGFESKVMEKLRCRFL